MMLGSQKSCLGIIAGGGTMPTEVARLVLASGRDVHVVGIEGAAANAIEKHPHTWVNYGEIGKILKILNQEKCDELVIIGGVKRPKMDDLRVDIGAVAHLPTIFKALVGGDNSVLSAIVDFFEKKGFRVIGAHEVAPELLTQQGKIGKQAPDKRDRADILLAVDLIDAMGRFDVGQAVVVAHGHFLAVEGAEGTDGLLNRCRNLTTWSPKPGEKRSGILVKCAKPTQERRIDLPAIGPQTVYGAKRAGLTGIAIGAGEVLIAERDKTIKAANKSGLFIFGIER